MEEVFIHYMNLPEWVDGFARKNQDDTYSIILNARCSKEKQQETLLHELEHIKNDDFHSELDAVNIESNLKKVALSGL